MAVDTNAARLSRVTGCVTRGCGRFSSEPIWPCSGEWGGPSLGRLGVAAPRGGDMALAVTPWTFVASTQPRCSDLGVIHPTPPASAGAPAHLALLPCLRFRFDRLPCPPPQSCHVGGSTS